MVTDLNRLRWANLAFIPVFYGLMFGVWWLLKSASITQSSSSPMFAYVWLLVGGAAFAGVSYAISRRTGLLAALVVLLAFVWTFGIGLILRRFEIQTPFGIYQIATLGWLILVVMNHRALGNTPKPAPPA